MDRSISKPAAGVAGRRPDRLSALRLGFVIAALGFVAALALLLVPGGTGPSDTLAVADLSSADRADDSTTSPGGPIATDQPDADRYVSANPFMSVLAPAGASARASLGIERLTPPDPTPRGLTTVCSAFVIGMPGGGFIDTGMQVCTATFTDSGTGEVLAVVVILRGYYDY